MYLNIKVFMDGCPQIFKVLTIVQREETSHPLSLRRLHKFLRGLVLIKKIF